MKIQLSDHFTYKKLLRFALPSVAMMIFTSIYGVVDGFFVSNFVGKTPFTAINFIFPFIMVLGSVGFMFGAGGSALISKTLGEKKEKKANQIFSMLTYVSAGVGVVIGVAGIFTVKPLALMLGAEGQLLEDCVLYARIILCAMPAFMLQQEFQSFFVAAEKPQMGLYTTIAAGVTNMILDALFIAVFKWGLVGAALATASSQIVGGIVPIVYFLRKNGSLLQLGVPCFDGKALLKTCTNGSSELLANVSMSLVGLLYNWQLKRIAGDDGVAAYGVMMYVGWIFVSIFVGYSIATAPLVGYNYGANNRTELRNLFKKNLVVMGALSLLMFILGEVFARPLSMIFVSYDSTVLEMTVYGFRIFTVQFLFCGLAIFGSGFFTALNNGLISALISFLRTLVFQIGAVLLLPLFISPALNGIWVSVVVAELAAATVSIICIIAFRNKYGYGRALTTQS